jgi:hypothetical protein
MAGETAYYVDFALSGLDNTVDTVTGFGTLTQKLTGSEWNIVGWTRDESVKLGPASITDGSITFLSDGHVTFSGDITGGSHFAVTGTASGFSYNTDGPAPVWSWSSLKWDSLAPLTTAGAFDMYITGAYDGSFSTTSTGSGTAIRYTATGTFSPVPIPSSLLLLAPAAFGIMVIMRKKPRNSARPSR